MTKSTSPTDLRETIEAAKVAVIDAQELSPYLECQTLVHCQLYGLLQDAFNRLDAAWAIAALAERAGK